MGPDRIPLLRPAEGPRGVRFWRGEDAGPTVRERILPTGRAQLIFDLDGVSATLIGPSFIPQDILRTQPTRLIGVVFAPGALGAYSRVTATELVDRSVELAEIWTLGSLLDELADLDVSSAERRIAQEFAAREEPDDARGTAARLAAVAICSGVGSARVAATVGMDRRQLVPLFRRTIGVGLKHFANLQRFRRSLRAMRSASPSSLAAIAADHGYSDQAHLTREIQAFAGVPPRVLHGEATTSTNHLSADRIFKTPPCGRSRIGA